MKTDSRTSSCWLLRLRPEAPACWVLRLLWELAAGPAA